MASPARVCRARDVKIRNRLSDNRHVDRDFVLVVALVTLVYAS